MNWDLTKLYAGFDDPAFLQDLKATREGFTAAIGRMESAAHGENDAAVVSEAIRAMSELSSPLVKLSHMIQLTLAADANHVEAKKYRDQLMGMYVQAEQLKSRLVAYVGVTDFDALIAAQDPLIEEHLYMLEIARREYSHLLDPKIEDAVLKLKVTGGYAWEQLRDILDANHMIEVEDGGETKRLPLSAVRGLAHSPDAKVRKAAYEAEIAAYPRIEQSVAACLNSIKGEALTVAELRRYDSLLDQSLETARMNRQTLSALIEAMTESLPDFRRYFSAKAKKLGHEGGLPFYDLFAPLGESAKRYTLKEAAETLYRVFGGFSSRMTDMIGRAFSENWIDAYPREGKVGGAFCAGSYPLKISYILTNFEGSLGSVTTLAHELGHAYHNECTKHLSILNADYPMPLAETASIFNETMLMDTLLRDAEGDEVLPMLDQQLIESSQVVVDILSRYLFETEVIERRKDRSIPPAELCDMMLDAQDKTYGDGLDPNFRHPYMWLCKSHYYSPDLHFYNFPYAFGLLFGLGVYARYESRGAAFAADYDNLLASTGLSDVSDVAKSVGIDVESVEFWRQSLGVIRGWIDRFCAIVEA